VANTTTAIMMPAGVCANWARLIVSSAATAQTGTVVALNATSYERSGWNQKAPGGNSGGFFHGLSKPHFLQTVVP
jgi:hypothetical protein